MSKIDHEISISSTHDNIINDPPSLRSLVAFMISFLKR